MSSVQHLREFISARLTAAAEEIFTEFEKTIEEEMDRQRRLLDISWKTADVPHQHVCKEEAFLEHQLYDQTCSPHLDQEEPQSLLVKSEEEEVPTNQEEEQLLQTYESHSVAASLPHTNNDLREAEPNRDYIPSYSCPVEEGLAGSKMNDFEPEQDANPTPSTSGNNSFPFDAAEKPYFCHTCGKRFFNMSSLERHAAVHRDERPYSCKTCGKRFSRGDHLTVHMRSHTGEKPYACDTCGKSFSLNCTLLRHARMHSSEKPFACETCGKSFAKCSSLLCHMRTHTGNRMYSCKTCGKSFNGSSHLVRHMRTHTGEKPYACDMCGKQFSQNSNVLRHMRTHR